MHGPCKASTARARSLRQVDNEAEDRLWYLVRDRRLNGYKFVRQLGIGPYFADFACRSAHLVVELDGGQHIDSAHDRRRDAFLAARGWSVVRFWSADMLDSEGSVMDTILAICDRRLTEAVATSEFRFTPALPTRRDRPG